MKKSQPLITVCLLSWAMAMAQQGRPFPPPGAGGASAESEAKQVLRGIDKKDIRRGMVIARQGVYDSRTLQQMEELTWQLVDAINAGAKLTKADAARSAAPPAELQRMAARIRQFQDESGSMLVIVRMTASSGGAARPCPVDHCQASVCGFYKNICVCIMCWPKMDSISRAAAESGGQPSSRGAELLVVAAPSDASDTEVESLINTGLSELRAMPESPQLVIKTKSPPQ